MEFEKLLIVHFVTSLLVFVVYMSKQQPDQVLLLHSSEFYLTSTVGFLANL